MVDVDVEDAPSSFKSEVWQHFDFPKTKNETGEVVTDKTKKLGAEYCKMMLIYTNSKTNMMQHIMQSLLHLYVKSY